MADEPLTPSKGYDKTVYCSNHLEKKAELYCDQCNRLMCRECIPHDHPCDIVANAFHKQEKDIATHLKPLEQQLTMFVDAVKTLDTTCKDILKQKTAVITQIHNVMADQHRALQLREADLVDQVERTTLKKLKSLEKQRSMFQLRITQMKSCHDFVKESQRACSQGEILRMKTHLVKQIDDLTNSFEQETLTIVEEADVSFKESPDSINRCQEFGKVYSRHSICPEKCRVSGEGMKVAMKGQTVSLSVEALDIEEEAYCKPVHCLRCELVASDDGSRVIGTVKRKDDKTYEITYQPMLIGEHQLHILAENQPILNSPFTINVLPDLTVPNRTIDNVKNPWGIAVREGGEVIVAESGRHCVTIISTNNEKRSFGECGRNTGMFDHPECLAIDASGNILVVEYDNHRIQKFSPTGEFLKSVGKRGEKEPLDFNQPVGIAIHPTTRQIYIADNRNHRVQVLNDDLSYCRSFGTKGEKCKEFRLPYDVATDSEGNVYVADYKNHRIQVFTVNDDYLREFSKKGSREALNHPAGITIDSRDLVYICEHKIHCISIFTKYGEFLKSFGGEGTGPVRFNEPHGVAIDKDGTIYVCDTCGNNCIQIFA